MLNGTTTAGVIAGNRIFITVHPEDMIRNIAGRGIQTHLDPKDLQDAEVFIETQREAERIITELPTDKEVKVIRVQNDFVETSEVRGHIEKICDNIMESLVIK